MAPTRSGRSRPDPDDEYDYAEPPRRREDGGHLATGHRVRRSGSPDARADHTAPRTLPVGARRAASAGSVPRRADRDDEDADTTMLTAQASRSRRRVGFRKGSDVDEELWPTETFGGVSDEQFWDDMASDKPLATTARTAAAPDPGSRRRLPDVVPSRDSDDRGRGDGSRIASGGSSSGSGAYPASAARSGPADRTAIQPIQTGPQRVQTGPHAIPTALQPIQTGPQPVPTGTQPTSVPARSYQPGTQPYPAAQSYQPGTQPAPISGQAGRAAQPADPRGRARTANGTDTGTGAAAGEDPLTSSAYSLRPPGAVNGRSYQSPRRSRDQYDAAVSQETQTFSLADTQAATGGYPSGVPPFRQFDQAAGSGNGRALESRPDAVRSDTVRYDDLRSDPQRTDALRTDALRADPLMSDGYWSGGRPDALRGAGAGDIYGSTAGHPYPERPYSDAAPSTAAMPSYPGYGYPASPADDPREPNGTRGQGRSGTGSWGARQSHPTGNGYRGPYDPRTNGRSLSGPLDSRAHWIHARGRRRLVHGSPPA
ncbi:MAG TPA: hypothetical protein VME19_11540 [Streptosporangiaceae bacterium]|nr:hypothetical protein [Streptosporangiaceae bacterium]